MTSAALRNRQPAAPIRPDVPTDRSVFDKYLRGGEQALNAADWAFVQNTMSTTTGSEGGLTVPSTVAAEIFDLQKHYSVMRTVADNIRTSDGTALPFPTSDGTAEVGELIAQNATATALDPVFGTAAITPAKFSSKVVTAPFELLQDSAADMEAWIAKRLAMRLARAANPYFTTGTGTAQPFGIVTRAAAGKVGISGQTLTCIYDDLIDLVGSVDPAYRGPRCGFMMSDTTWKMVRKLKDSAGATLFPPAATTAPRVVVVNADGEMSHPVSPVAAENLLGYPVWINNDMASPAANAKSILFGDFSAYVIRDVVGSGLMSLLRLTDSAYAKLGQVGFLAWARMGGNLLDPNAVKYYQHSAA